VLTIKTIYADDIAFIGDPVLVWDPIEGALY
jgi:hypothetical protein